MSLTGSILPLSRTGANQRQPAARLHKYLIVLDNRDRVGDIVRLSQSNIFEAPERTIIIVFGQAAACSSGVLTCSGIAMVDAKRRRFAIIHAGFPDDLSITMRFALRSMRSRADDLIIGMTGMKGYTVAAMRQNLAAAGEFGRVVYAKLGVGSDIAVDFIERRISGADDRVRGMIETPPARF